MHPSQIGVYEIVKRIGAGGMGNVYLGRHSETAEEVAIKVLPASMAREPGFVERFRREIQALQSLTNPHIVRFIESGTLDDTFYYVMEYVDGNTLNQVITDQRRLPYPVVLDYVMQIARALKAAHDAGFIHRDLKPSNLMVTEEEEIKLTDFGVAQVFAAGRLTRTGGVVGTAEYMSPEQAAGKRLDKTGDLYSLGAVMYAMLTGRPPFQGETAAEIMHKHRYAQFDRPSHYAPDLPRLLEEVVLKLLEKDPARRFRDAFVLIRHLENVEGRLKAGEGLSEALTVVRNSGERSNAEESSDVEQSAGMIQDDGPGPATLVRDAFRHEFSAEARKGPVGRFFDNTFVLVLLLAAMIAGGFYFTGQRESDRAPLQEARSILSEKPTTRWLNARDSLLIPLLETNDLSDEDRAEAETLIVRADQYEFCRSLKRTFGNSAESPPELQRLIRQAFRDYTEDRRTAAIRELSAILQLPQVVRTDDYLSSFLKDTLSQWESEQLESGRLQFLRETLNAIATDGLSSEERQLQLDAVLTLYDQRLLPDEVRNRIAALQAEDPQRPEY